MSDANNNIFNVNHPPPPPPQRTPFQPVQLLATGTSRTINTPIPINNPYQTQPTNIPRSMPNVAAPSVIKPRVGNVEGGIAWTGGSNVPRRANIVPRDVRCFRPTDFRSMQEQDKLLKQGVPEEMKLTLVDENEKDSQTVSAWIDEVKFLIETNGMDTVFRIYNVYAREIYMFDN